MPILPHLTHLPYPPTPIDPPHTDAQPAARRTAVHATHQPTDLALPARITRAASKQAYYTVRFLVDRDRMLDAYRAYAYFRWVDDTLDQRMTDRAERLAFVARQQSLVDAGYRRAQPDNLIAEERLLIDLIAGDVAGDDEVCSGLQSYIRNMMAVMAFDANRRGQLISDCELGEYARMLATAVTDALHHFIGHQDTPPSSTARYLPAMGAHITHMLRDTFEDVASGYFNVPSELLDTSGIMPGDVTSAPYCEWVRSRVELARQYFRAGADYLDHVPSLRCRLAGCAYMARFVGVLDAIERDEYRIRPAYPEFTRTGYALRVGGSVCARALLRGQR